MDRIPRFGYNWDQNLFNQFHPTVTRRGNYIERTYLKRDGTIGKILSLADDAVHRPRKQRDGTGVWRTLHPYELDKPGKVKSTHRTFEHSHNSMKRHKQNDANLNSKHKPKSSSSKDSKYPNVSTDKMTLPEKDSLSKESSTKESLENNLSESTETSTKSRNGGRKERRHSQRTTSLKSFNQLHHDRAKNEDNYSVNKSNLKLSRRTFDHKNTNCSLCDLLETKKAKADAKYCENVVQAVKNEILALQIVIKRFLDSCHESKNELTKTLNNHSLIKSKQHENSIVLPENSEEKVTRSISAPEISKCRQIEKKVKDGMDLNPSDLFTYVSECQGSILIPLSSKSPITLIPPDLMSSKKEPTKRLKNSKISPRKLEFSPTKKRPTKIGGILRSTTKKDMDCYRRYRLLKLQKPAPMDRVSQYIRDCCLDIFKLKTPEETKNTPDSFINFTKPKSRKVAGKEVHFDLPSSSDSIKESFSSLIRRRMECYSNHVISSRSSATKFRSK